MAIGILIASFILGSIIEEIKNWDKKPTNITIPKTVKFLGKTFYVNIDLVEDGKFRIRYISQEGGFLPNKFGSDLDYRAYDLTVASLHISSCLEELRDDPKFGYEY